MKNRFLSHFCPLWVGEDLLPQMSEFKYLGVLIMSEGNNGAGIDEWMGPGAF